MDGGEVFFDIDGEIARISASVAKSGSLVAAEKDLLATERAIEAIRAEVAELDAAGQAEAAGAARKRLVAAMAEHGKLMNGSQAWRVAYYAKRAHALQPTHQRGIDAIGQILDLALPGTTWGELMASDRLRTLIVACNRIAITISTWGDRPKFVLPMREDGFRNLVARHRSR